MPGGDRTGPLGLGAMTVRAAGYCAGYPVPGFMNPIVGYPGYGRGFGRGLGYRYMPYGPAGFWYNPAITAEEELSMLKEHAKLLQRQLEEIQKHVKTLEEESKQEKK